MVVEICKLLTRAFITVEKVLNGVDNVFVDWTLVDVLLLCVGQSGRGIDQYVPRCLVRFSHSIVNLRLLTKHIMACIRVLIGMQNDDGRVEN